MTRLDISNTRPLFGPATRLYGPVVAGVVPRVTSVEYRFWDNDSILAAHERGVADDADLNAIAVLEVLLSAHLAASTSIVRSVRWFEATWREYEADNLLGWAACCRSLLEAVGDTIDGLLGMGVTIAETMPTLMRALTGFDEGLLNLAELEDKLIHFSHARKLGRDERGSAPSTHAARQTTHYIQLLETAGGPAKLYAELCQIGHPARGSLSWMYEGVTGGFRIGLDRDAEAIQKLVRQHREGLWSLPSLAFNPGLLVLRALVRFGLFPKLPELRDFAFQGAKAWDTMRPMLDAAPRTMRRHPLVDKLLAQTAEPAGGVAIDR